MKPPLCCPDSTAPPLATQRGNSPANRFATGPTPARLLAYGLKHTALSRMIRAGVDIVTVSEIAGHSDIKMTMIYCHSDGQSKREAVEKVSRIYFQPPKVADAPAAAAQPDHQTEGMVS